MKDRVTLTLDRALVRRIDATVDGMQVKNRSHAIEMLLYQALEGDMPTQAVVLAGGPLARARDCLKMIGDATLLERNVQLLADAGLQHIFVVTSILDEVEPLLGDGSRFDVQITYVTESTPLGSGGCLHLVRPYLRGPIIVTYGTAYKNVDVRDVFQFHKQHNGLCTIALTTVPDPSQYGVALLNGNRIITFIEKPAAENAPSNLISSGFYIMDFEVLEGLPDGYAKMEYDVFPVLAKQDRLFGYHFPGEYLDSTIQ